MARRSLNLPRRVFLPGTPNEREEGDDRLKSLLKQKLAVEQLADRETESWREIPILEALRLFYCRLDRCSYAVRVCEPHSFNETTDGLCGHDHGDYAQQHR